MHSSGVSKFSTTNATWSDALEPRAYGSGTVVGLSERGSKSGSRHMETSSESMRFGVGVVGLLFEVVGRCPVGVIGVGNDSSIRM